MALEKSLWSWLSGARRSLGEALHINRIENLVMRGMPDVEGYLRLPDCEGQFWLELKSQERPARRTTPIRFKLKNREEQIEWLARRWALGANVFWLLQVGSFSERTLYLAPGPLGPQLKRGLTEAELMVACCNTGIFTKRISQVDILKRAISCRYNNPSLFPR